jgi:5-methylthioadenosine/S-adenosylhomocysteine deaminase
MPGLVNAHTHSPMSLFRGIADDVNFQTFLFDRIWPREQILSPSDVYSGSMLSAVEMLKCGVTTYVDMYFWEEELVRAALDTGMRTLITPGILDVPAWTRILGPWEKRTEELVSFCHRWQGFGGRIHTGLGPHAPYSLPLEALKEIAITAQRERLPIHIHLVETKSERDDFNARSVGSTVSALQSIGFFDGEVTAAHSIWLDEGDAEIYAQHGVGVAHCPGSNAKLGAGIAPVTSMTSAGVRIGIGTDGAATNNNHDLWEELLLTPLFAKALSLDPTVISAEQALWMATRLGAQAIHLRDIGQLRTGFKADLITLTIEDPAAIPVFCPQTYIGHLVYAMNSRLVDSAWVNGVRVLKHGEVLTVDEPAVRAAGQNAALAVARRAMA